MISPLSILMLASVTMKWFKNKFPVDSEWNIKFCVFIFLILICIFALGSDVALNNVLTANSSYPNAITHSVSYLHSIFKLSIYFGSYKSIIQVLWSGFGS